MDTVDAIVAGAGVVGLACGRALALQGREVLVLEAEAEIGTGISSRNSEVIHGGLYYPAGSLKARLCVRGRHLLYGYARERGVGAAQCGKLVVATDDAQRGALHALHARAHANGVDDAVLLDAAQALAMEPALFCVEALLSPGTGIVDSHGLMLSFHGDIDNAGGMVVCQAPIVEVRRESGGYVVCVEGADPIFTKVFVNSAGLGAQGIARTVLPPDAVAPLHYARGQYFSLSGRAPFSRLVYPMPEPGGLGVHFTLDMGGQGKFGPDVQWTDTLDYRPDGGRGEAFYVQVRKYFPGLADDALQPSYVGIRPKISGPGAAAEDFRIDGAAAHGLPGLINLFGIESPGLTASMAIAEHVTTLLEQE